MDAIDQFPPLAPAAADDVGLPPFASADRQVRICQGLTALAGLGVLALAGVWWSSGPGSAGRLLAELRQTRLVPVMLVSLIIPLAGSLATWIMAWARRRAATEPRAEPSNWRRALTVGRRGEAGLVGRAARWPQAIAVGCLTLFAMACTWLPGIPAPTAALTPANNVLFGAAALVLSFPLLIVERWLAAIPPARLPEAPALRRLFLLPVLAWPIAGLAQIAAAVGVPPATRVDAILLAALAIVAGELLLRALGRCFLPPPAPAVARAAIDSLLARVVAEGVRGGSLATPVRQHLGIDFARSWALAYLRAAIPPVVLLLLLLSWGLSGVVLVGVDQRAVYERFGAPVAVLHPGPHLILPWPMGQVRRLEFGAIHETTLTDTGAAALHRVGAEDPAPPEDDRLWEQSHPSELIFLIASGTAQRQTFQVVSADIKLRYRIGLTDQAALLAAYQVSDPVALLRASAGRVIGGFFAGQTLDAVLGENREAVADRLRITLQRDLDAFGSGIELAGVVIEAIHPPAGAAAAYHDVQAAEIRAATSIAAERGRAVATQAKASQYATELVAEARAAAAETTATATADLTRFTADHAAAIADADSFLLERRLTAMANGLAKSGLTIIDSRIPAAEAPVLDLRPMTPSTARSSGPDQE